MLAHQNMMFQEAGSSCWNEAYILEALGADMLHVYLKNPHTVKSKVSVKSKGSYVLTRKNISKMVIKYKRD